MFFRKNKKIASTETGKVLEKYADPNRPGIFMLMLTV